MENKKSTHLNFILLLSVVFVFSALVLVAIGNFREINAPVVNNADELKSEEYAIAEKFGLEAQQPQFINDPVLGVQTVWTSGETTLTINDLQVIYRNDSASSGKIADSKVLQEAAQQFLNGKNLDGNVILNYEKNKFLKKVDGHFEEAQGLKDAQVLEVIFDDIETGEDKIKVLVGGGGEIFEVSILRD